jgi:hypothetical protein
MEEEKKVNGVFIWREKWEEVMLEIKISYFHYLVKGGGVGDWWDLGFSIRTYSFSSQMGMKTQLCIFFA